MTMILSLIGAVLSIIGIVQFFRNKHRQALMIFVLANGLLCVNSLLLANMGTAIFNCAVALFCAWTLTKIPKPEKSDE